MISRKSAYVAIAALVFLATPIEAQAADSPTSGEMGWLLIALFYLPWLESVPGRGGTPWKFLCFAFCTISIAFVALAVLSIITVPVASPSIIAGSVITWLIAWVCTAAARSAVGRYARDEAVLGELRKQNKLREEEAKEARSGRKCPFCAELVKREAIVCKHCGRDLPPVEEAAPTPAAQSMWDRMWEGAKSNREEAPLAAATPPNDPQVSNAEAPVETLAAQQQQPTVEAIAAEPLPQESDVAQVAHDQPAATRRAEWIGAGVCVSILVALLAALLLSHSNSSRVATPGTFNFYDSGKAPASFQNYRTVPAR
jgi:hypothetical protein